MGERHKRAALSRKQERFIAEYDACNGNASQAARNAGYNGNANTIGVTANRDLLTNPKIKARIAELERSIGERITPNRVKRRLDEISHAAERDGQYGPAVRAEELLGKSIGMWIDQSLNLTGALNDSHIAALLEIARRRSTETVDNDD